MQTYLDNVVSENEISETTFDTILKRHKKK